MSSMNLQIVQIGDLRVSNCLDDVLVTYALGSCVAVVIHDKVAGVGGLLHILLPDSKLDLAKAQTNPWTFADTGIPALFKRAYALGASKKDLRVYLAGGAQVNIDSSYFNVGSENIKAARRILERANVAIHSECVGGTAARTVRLQVATGRISLQRTETGIPRSA